MAIGSLVASLIGLPFYFFCYLGAISSIVGIVLGFVAINRIKQSGENGRALAIAGIAVGGVSLVFSLLIVFIVIATNSW
jgi:hypothetical protein